MRDTLTSHLMIWFPWREFAGRRLVDPLPMQILMLAGFLICVAFHFSLVLPFQFKDELCIKLMGRTNAVS
ncbi:unnamed protein product, partial [Aphanomyces euteiches]